MTNYFQVKIIDAFRNMRVQLLRNHLRTIFFNDQLFTEHMLSDRCRLDFSERNRHLLEVVLVISHLADRQGVLRVVVHQLCVQDRRLQEVGAHSHDLSMKKNYKILITSTFVRLTYTKKLLHVFEKALKKLAQMCQGSSFILFSDISFVFLLKY